MKFFRIASFLALLPCIVYAQPKTDKIEISKEQVISQMNYCVNSITNIVHYKSMTLLEHEIDQLLNNLTMEQVVGLYEVQSFRSEMIERISALQITEEERRTMMRIQELKRENLLYQSISNALSPTLLITGGPGTIKQIAFTAIVTAARTAVEYKSAANEADIEELQAMWQYRKEDLKNFAELRKDALNLVYSLFQKYGLNERDRLTESTSTLLSQIIAEKDPHAKIRKLRDNKQTFDGIADYHYHLGMAYVDASEYQVGQKHLDKYLKMYETAPIFRYDEKTGCIALTKLAFDNNLSNSDVIHLVDIATTNLPNNGPAIIQSVLALNLIGEKERAANLLRSGIDNDRISDKNALVVLATQLLPEIKSYPESFAQISAAVKHCAGLNINSYIPFIVNSHPDYWDELESVIKINNKNEIVIDPQYTVDINSFIVQKEERTNRIVKILPTTVNYSNGISIKKIQKRFKSLKSNTDQIYIFFDPINDNGIYKVKPNLDYKKIIDGDYSGMSSPYIPSSEREKLAKFCEKQNNKYAGNTKIVFSKDKNGNKSSLSLKYADYLIATDTTYSIDYSNYSDTTDTDICKVDTKDNVFRINPPLKNAPEELIRVILPCVDTIQLCFSREKENYTLYSIYHDNQEHFKYAYVATMRNSGREIDKPVKRNWFQRSPTARFAKKVITAPIRFYKKMITAPIKFTKKVINKIKSNHSEDEIDSQHPKEDVKETIKDTHESTSNDNSWLKKLWRAICFWKK